MPPADAAMRLTLDVEGGASFDGLPGDGAALVAFMSFAVVRGFGAQHALVALAEHVGRDHDVRLGPLTTFYERTPEDAEDAEKLEMAWQDAGDLHDSLEALLAAVSGDDACQVLLRRGHAADLPAQAAALLGPVAAARDAGSRVRLVYDL